MVAGLGEGIGALFQGFASVYGPMMIAKREKEQREKDRAARQAEAAADRALRQQLSQDEIAARKDILAEELKGRKDILGLTQGHEKTMLGLTQDYDWDKFTTGHNWDVYKSLTDFEDRRALMGDQFAHERAMQGSSQKFQKGMQGRAQKFQSEEGRRDRIAASNRQSAEQDFRSEEADKQRAYETIQGMETRLFNTINTAAHISAAQKESSKAALSEAVGVVRDQIRMAPPGSISADTAAKYVTRLAAGFESFLTPGSNQSVLQDYATKLQASLAILKDSTKTWDQKQAAMQAAVDTTANPYELFPKPATAEPPPLLARPKDGVALTASGKRREELRASTGEEAGASPIADAQAAREGINNVVIAGQERELPTNKPTGWLWDRWAAQNPQAVDDAFRQYKAQFKITGDDDKTVQGFKDWMLTATEHYSKQAHGKRKMDPEGEFRMIDQVLKYLRTGQADILIDPVAPPKGRR